MIEWGFFFLHLFCARRGDGSQLVTLQEEEEEEKTKKTKKKKTTQLLHGDFISV